MNTCKIVDARMGRGKTTAAIRYMTDNPGDGPFLYVTPFLKEVSRICSACGFDEPNQVNNSKMNKLKALLQSGKNVATTHALYRDMPDEVLAIASEKGYTLILDETINMVESYKLTGSDVEVLTKKLADRVDPDGRVVWNDDSYSGFFSEAKKRANQGELYYLHNILYCIMSPSHLTSFKDVYILTYLFEGGVMGTYFKYFKLPYCIIGIKEDDKGPYFSDEPDKPPRFAVKDLITLVGEPCITEWDRKIIRVGRPTNSFSAGWFTARGADHKDIKDTFNGLVSFINRYNGRVAKGFIWTTFKGAVDKICQRGRFTGQFLPLNARATNAYRDCTAVAYLANRFMNPTINHFFSSAGLQVDDDVYALSEMLQFIWRSAIRDGQHINLYIPSLRMRKMLKTWMDEQDSLDEVIQEAS